MACCTESPFSHAMFAANLKDDNATLSSVGVHTNAVITLNGELVDVSVCVCVCDEQCVSCAL